MDKIISYICVPFGYLMKGCWLLVSNYGLAIILFTLAIKLVLLPLSVWIHKNSIIMVKIQPEVNFLKANMQGNLDGIAEGQAKIYKKAHYHPLLSIVPLILQVILLLAVVKIIYNPFNFILGNTDVAGKVASFLNINKSSSMWQLKLINAIKNGEISSSTVIAGVESGQLVSLINSVNKFKLSFLGLNLSTVPTEVWKVYVLVPILAGASSFVMCFTQNVSNVLQHEQSKWNQYGIMVVSVALSLYLGLFVPTGIAIYWIASNLLSVAQMYALNAIINPKKYVDYEALEQSRKALADAKAFGKVDKKDPKYKENKKREKQDYKRFKHVVNKHVVFYSEKSGFYKYYKDIIENLLSRSNLIIHYITNDPDDKIFELAKSEPRIRPYYISLKKLVVLMMLVECDIFIMTTPDLNKYYLKRSYIKKDIEYIYVPHDLMSSFYITKGATENFDTVFVVGDVYKQEIRNSEDVYKLKKKTIVEFGYPFSDYLDEQGRIANEQRAKEVSDVKTVLIAPSWQEDNILDSCLDDMISSLYCDGYEITVRPHPEYLKRYGFRMEKILEKYKDYDSNKLKFELDFSANKSIFTSDIIITDWSSVAFEFCFATKRPALFINTKEKCDNPEWEKIGLQPVQKTLRNQIGMSIEKEEVPNCKKTVDYLLASGEEYNQKIAKIYDELIYNHGCAGQKGAQYILKSLAEKMKK